MSAASVLHVIDFEGNRLSGILEYGVVTLTLTGDIAAVQTRLCRALGPVAAEETRLHGLRGESVAACAPFADDWEAFCRLRASGPFAAHHAGAENGLIKSVWAYPRLSPDFARPGESAAEWGPWIDTAVLAGAGAAGTELGALVAAWKLRTELDALAATLCPYERRHYHAALYDALAAALLLRAFLARPENARATLPWLLQQSARRADRRERLQQRELF